MGVESYFAPVPKSFPRTRPSPFYTIISLYLDYTGACGQADSHSPQNALHPTPEPSHAGGCEWGTMRGSFLGHDQAGKSFLRLLKAEFPVFSTSDIEV